MRLVTSPKSLVLFSWMFFSVPNKYLNINILSGIDNQNASLALLPATPVSGEGADVAESTPLMAASDFTELRALGGLAVSGHARKRLKKKERKEQFVSLCVCVSVRV